MIPSIELKNLVIGLKKNNETKLVNNISFTLRKGQTLGIVGESGSGKTLSVMAIVNLLPSLVEIKSGDIFLIEENKKTELTHATFNKIKKIRGKSVSVIFQEPLSSLNPSVKCGKQVLEIIMAHEQTKNKNLTQRVLKLFEDVDLPDPKKAFNSFPFELSGGQQQRIMIAMAIANNPDFIIADEPTTALDVLVQKKIIALLKNIQNKYGMGIIFISHDIDLVAQISDDIIVMRNGKIEEKGTKNEILNDPKSEYTKKLITLKPRPDTPRLDKYNNTLNTRNSLLQVTNLDIYYCGKKNMLGRIREYFHIVKSVSFNVYEGETLGIVGGSGSGKSTLGKSVIHLFEKLHGSIKYRNKEISKLTEKEFKVFRKKIQLIFQDPYGSLNPKLTVGKAIFEVLKANNRKIESAEGKKRVEKLLVDVKLDTTFIRRYPHELSGGQRQRIVIARALAVEPELIICDESVSALDVSIQAEILHLLNELKLKKNLTYIFISHDLAVVKYLSDRILVLNNGEIEEISNPDDLFSSPKSEYTKKLLDAMITIKNP